MSIKTFYKKHVNRIIVVIFILFLFKSCQSCSRKRQLEYTSYQTEQKIDSLNGVIDSCKYVISHQQDSINRYKFEISVIQDNNDMLKGMNKHFQNANKTLIDTNKKLTNKEE